MPYNYLPLFYACSEYAVTEHAERIPICYDGICCITTLFYIEHVDGTCCRNILQSIIMCREILYYGLTLVPPTLMEKRFGDI